MFCPKCGNLLNDNEKYCRSCGAKVERSESKVNAPGDIGRGGPAVLYPLCGF